MISFWSVFLLWLIPATLVSIFLAKMPKWWLFLGGLLMTIYGSVAAITMIADGETIKSLEFEYAGHALLIFFTVIGGSLINIALKEVRDGPKIDS